MMRRFLFALIGCCFLSSGCATCSCCALCDWCHFGQAKDDCNCSCLTDGSESPKYKPPGPFWTRPDGGCPKNCRTYQEARQAVVHEARYLQLQSATQVGLHPRGPYDYNGPPPYCPIDQ